MIYPEIPKSKRKSSYIVGGIFAIFVGIILLLLFLPKFTDKILGIVLFDWSTILPSITPDFFLNVGNYVQIALPIVLFLCVVASFFMGLSKSSMFLKISIACSTLAYLLKYSLTPANLTNSIVNALNYFEYVLFALAFVFIILGIIFRFKGNEVYVPYHANSFHIFSSIALFVILSLDVFSKILKIDSITSNSRYYYCAVIALFLIIAGIWMLCSSKRDPSEFGTGYEREHKKQPKDAQEQQAQADNQLNAQNVNEQNAQNSNEQNAEAPEQNAQEQQTQQTTQQVFADGRPTPQPEPQPQANPNLQVVGENTPPQAQPAQAAQPAQPAQPQAQPTQPQPPIQGQPQPPIPKPMSSGLTPPRPANLPPRLGPDGKPLPPFPPRPANMPQRIGPDGRPLPPFPPRPMNIPLQKMNAQAPKAPNPAQPQGQPPVQPQPQGQPQPPIQGQPQPQPAQPPVQPQGQPTQPVQPNGNNQNNTDKGE